MKNKARLDDRTLLQPTAGIFGCVQSKTKKWMWFAFASSKVSPERFDVLPYSNRGTGRLEGILLINLTTMRRKYQNRCNLSRRLRKLYPLELHWLGPRSSWRLCRLSLAIKLALLAATIFMFSLLSPLFLMKTGLLPLGTITLPPLLTEVRPHSSMLDIQGVGKITEN
jgi:hypothetical protein